MNLRGKHGLAPRFAANCYSNDRRKEHDKHHRDFALAKASEHSNRNET